MRFHHRWLVLVVVAAAPVLAAAASASGPVAHLASGAVQGKVQGDINVFEGIPFAAPPVGDLRWREPQPVAKWQGVRDATKPGHSCFQNPQGLNAFLTPLAATYQSPYTPEVVDPSGGLPVSECVGAQSGGASSRHGVGSWRNQPCGQRSGDWLRRR